MPKRSFDDVEEIVENDVGNDVDKERGSPDRSIKRLRPNKPDRISALSDELLLRTLSFLSTQDLVLCQRCAKWKRLKTYADHADSLAVCTLSQGTRNSGRLFSTIDS